MANRPGRLEIIHGCMFSGKSTELVRRLIAAEKAGHRVIAFKPRRDDRYAADRIVTHDGAAIDAVAIDRAGEIDTRGTAFDVLGVDEIHFFGPGLVDVCRRVLETPCRLVLAGVDIDHRGAPFPAFPPLLAMADEAVRTTARCARCGGVAEFSQRMIADDAAIVVGGAESYEPRCPACFTPPP
jgi:thymidine kinase